MCIRDSIYGVKISDNVELKEDEPRVLFVGQLHAEEVLGVEAVLDLILLMLDPPPEEMQHMNILKQNIETWIIPTLNPEGLNVVHEGLDVSFRKNKTDFSPVGPFPNNYFDHEFGLTYIDDFLSTVALESLRKFLLGTTIWFDIKNGALETVYTSEES